MLKDKTIDCILENLSLLIKINFYNILIFLIKKGYSNILQKHNHENIEVGVRRY
jgi:hypothetical protein